MTVDELRFTIRVVGVPPSYSDLHSSSTRVVPWPRFRCFCSMLALPCYYKSVIFSYCSSTISHLFSSKSQFACSVLFLLCAHIQQTRTGQKTSELH